MQYSYWTGKGETPNTSNPLNWSNGLPDHNQMGIFGTDITSEIHVHHDMRGSDYLIDFWCNPDLVIPTVDGIVLIGGEIWLPAILVQHFNSFQEEIYVKTLDMPPPTPPFETSGNGVYCPDGNYEATANTMGWTCWARFQDFVFPQSGTDRYWVDIVDGGASVPGAGENVYFDNHTSATASWSSVLNWSATAGTQAAGAYTCTIDVATASLGTLTISYASAIVSTSAPNTLTAGATSLTGTLQCNDAAISLATGVTTAYGLTINAGGTFTGGSGTHTIGSISSNTATSSCTMTSGTCTLNGVSGGSGSNTLTVLSTSTFNHGGGTVVSAISTAINIRYVLGGKSLNNVVVNQNAGATLYFITSVGNIAGSLTNTLGTTYFYDTGGTTTITGLISVNGGNVQIGSSRTVVANGGITINGGTLAPVATGTIDCNGAFLLSSGTYSHAVNTVSTFSGATWTASGGTLTCTNGTTSFDGGGAIAVTNSLAGNFFNISTATASTAVTQGSDITAGGTYTLAASTTWTTSATPYNLTVTGTSSITGTLTTTTATVATTGLVTVNTNGTFGGATAYTWNINGGATNSGGTINFGTGTDTLAANKTIANTTGTANINGGYFYGASASTSIVTSGGTWNWATVTTKLLDFQFDITTGGGSITITVTDNITIDAFTVSANDTLACTTQDKTITGNSAKIITIAGAITSTGASGHNIIWTGYQAFAITTTNYQVMTFTTFTGLGATTAWNNGVDISIGTGAGVVIDTCTLTNNLTGMQATSGQLIQKDASSNFIFCGMFSTSESVPAGYRAANVTGNFTSMNADAYSTPFNTSYTLGAVMTNVDSLTVNASTTFSTGSNYALTASLTTSVSGTLTGNASTVTFVNFTMNSGGTYTATSATTTCSKTWTVSATATFTHSSGTVNWSSAISLAPPTIMTTGGKTFYNLTISNSGSCTYQVSGDLDINGTWSITNASSTLDIDTYDPAVNTAGSVSIPNGFTIDITSRTGRWTFDGTTTYTDSTAVTPLNIGNISISGTLTASSDIGVKALEVTATGTLSYNVGSRSLYINGDDFYIAAGGTVNGVAGAVLFQNVCNYQDDTVGQYIGSLRVNAAVTCNSSIYGTTALVGATGELIYDGQYVYISNSICVLFTITNGGKLTPGSGTFVVLSTSCITYTDNNATAQNVGDLLVQSDLILASHIRTNDITLNVSADIDAGSNTIYVLGDWTRTLGVFEYDTSTVVFEGTSLITGMQGTTDRFYDIEVSAGASATTADRVMIQGTLSGTRSFSGASSNFLYVHDLTIIPTGTFTSAPDPAGGGNSRKVLEIIGAI